MFILASLQKKWGWGKRIIIWFNLPFCRLTSHYFPQRKTKSKKSLYWNFVGQMEVEINNYIHSFSHKHLKNQTALSKLFWKLKIRGLIPKIQWKILKRSTTPSCFDETYWIRNVILLLDIGIEINIRKF